MGIFLIILGITIVIGIIILIYICNEYNHVSLYKRLHMTISYTSIWVLVIGLIYGVATIVSITNSYDTYLESRAYYDNVIAQYKGAITLYEDKAVSLNMEKAV